MYQICGYEKNHYLYLNEYSMTTSTHISKDFSHPDHLGSTSYITNLLGEVSQHMEYFAFGETFVEEHRSSNNSPYKFNGKELDEETGWYYYGARYYDPRVSVWLSVDPLAEMTVQPYQYGNQNPIKYVDSNGLKGDDWVETNGKMLYDSRVTDQNSAEVYYGDDAKYYAPGEKYQSVNNTSVELGLGGYFKEDGVTNRAIDNAPSVYAFPLDGSSGVTAVSAFTSYKRYTQYNKFFEIWRGKNGKIYNGLKGRGPNGVTGSRGYAKGKASQIGIAGNVLGIISMGMTELEFQYNMNQNPGPNLKKYLENRRIRDQSFNGAGFLGQFGAAASFGYNLGYLIEDVCNCNIQINPYTLDFTPIEQTLTDFDNAGYNIYGD